MKDLLRFMISEISAHHWLALLHLGLWQDSTPGWEHMAEKTAPFMAAGRKRERERQEGGHVLIFPRKTQPQ